MELFAQTSLWSVFFGTISHPIDTVSPLKTVDHMFCGLPRLESLWKDMLLFLDAIFECFEYHKLNSVYLHCIDVVANISETENIKIHG